jgi:DeoR/GlpR family transcriptional regulator of sugar metabolism
MQRIKSEIQNNGAINIVLDAGSTTLFVARAIAAALETGAIRSDTFRCFTNSPVNIAALLDIMQLRGRRAELFLIGGPLKYETRAFTPTEATATEQLKAAKTDGRRTIAFLGVTSVDPHGLKTRTADEVPIKHVCIDLADHVYVLADHSKTKKLAEWHVFGEWQKEKMSIITDRIDDPEMGALRDLVTTIW